MTTYTIGANTGNTGALTTWLMLSSSAASVLHASSVAIGSTTSAARGRLAVKATFPVSGVGTVTNAKLWLYNADAAAVARAYEARSLVNSFTENQVTYNKRNSATNWNVAGALAGTDVNATVIATGNAPTTAATTFFLSGAGLNAWVQGCIDGSITVTDLIVSAVDETTTFAQSNRVTTDVAGNGLRPTLVFDYTPATPPTVSVSDVTVSNVSGEAVFTVSLSSTYAANVTVDYATADQTATAGVDYTAVSGTLTFTPGQTIKTVTVPILP